MSQLVHLIFFVLVTIGLAYGSAYAASTMPIRVWLCSRSYSPLMGVTIRTFLYCPTCQAFWYGAAMGWLFDPMQFMTTAISTIGGLGAYGTVGMACAYGFFRNHPHPSADDENNLVTALLNADEPTQVTDDLPTHGGHP